VLVADAGVIRTLRSRVAGFRKAERAAVLVEEVFLLEAEPCVFVLENGRAAVGSMRRDAVRHHDFAHDENAVGASRIRIKGDGLQYAIGAAAFGLHRGRAVEAPKRKLFERRKVCEFLDLRLTTQVWYRSVAVEPNILELVFCHLRTS